MSLTYLCPKCRAILNPNVRVVLIAHFGDRKGLVLLSPKLGDFKFHCDKGFYDGVHKGDLLEFHCPVCSESLTSPTMEHFTEMLLLNGDRAGAEPKLLRFSRVSEERATFVYDGESVKEFGEDAEMLHKRMELDRDWSW